MQKLRLTDARGSANIIYFISHIESMRFVQNN